MSHYSTARGRLTDDVTPLKWSLLLALWQLRVDGPNERVEDALRDWLLAQRIRDDSDHERVKERLCDLWELGIECSDDELDERDWLALLLDEYEHRKGW